MSAKNGASPSPSELNRLLEHYQNGRYDDAEKSAISLSKQFPHHNFSWKILGEVLKNTGRLSEAVFAGKKTVEINPDDAKAHYNLGNTLQELRRLEESEVSYKQAIALKSDFAEAHSNLGTTLQELGRLEEAEASYRQAIALKTDFAEAHSNLGNTLKELGRLEEAVASYRQAITLNSDFAEAHSNLGHTLQELGRLEESEASYRQAIVLKPDYAEAHSNLGNTLQELRRLEESEVSYKQAIALQPDFAEAHSNLGNTLQELRRLEESEASYKQAIALQPDFAEAHSNLGTTLQELGRLEEAVASYRQAIVLKSDFAEAHSNLGITLYMNGDIDSALESIEKANDIEPKIKDFTLLLSVLNSRKSRNKSEVGVGNISNLGCVTRLTSNPLILNRAVEPGLVANLYDINTRELGKNIDSRFGNGKTTDWDLFKNNRFLMKTVVDDLIGIMKEAVKSDIFIYDSFFNILGAGSGSNPHTHINSLDKVKVLSLGKQKYVFQYYLRVGDQNCSEPGIYKLYEPNYEILPSEGMIIIIPAERMHSAVYGGKTDRVMVGINFYSL